MSKRKYEFYTKWKGKNLECACLVVNPFCNKHRECEELELTLNPYDDIGGCMKERSYKRKHGVIVQK